MAVLAEDEVTAFAGRDVTVAHVPAKPSPLRGVKRASIEFHRRVGGLPQRAMLGGTMTWSGGDELRVEVRTSGRIDLDAAPSYEGALGHPLVPGLPGEFGAAVMAALLAEADQAGTMVVDRAAYDPVESSIVAFGAAAVLLAAVLRGTDSGTAVRAKLEEFR
ncbi:hypothetical protein [Nonomuraea sp. SYSU D8015]|uniref:hypothetical protein n=1 Tax=Nonomuraea sp. SYSU D8015 TaxID=2593644 RepID=UPI0016617EF5|nr:hypothetical protein [Nonomuraea sp. SYSU D8015]